MLLEEADDLYFKWALTCPTCLSELSGIISKKGWLQFDPICPKCQRTIAGFTNPCWPPAPMDAEVLEAQRMLRVGR